MKTRARRDAIVRVVKPVSSAAAHGSVLREFIDAVLAVADDPRANVERYLAASRTLEESRRPTGVRQEPRARLASA